MDRTYVFNSDGNGGNSYPVMPGMFGGGLGSGQDGLWGLIYLAVFASIFGWNGSGFGGGFGGRGGVIPAELSGDAGRELLMQALQGNRTAIDGIASSLSCSGQQVQAALSNIQNTLGLSGQQIINAVQSGNSGIVNQMSTCCCNILQSIERTSATQQLQNCQNLNTLTNAINGGIRDLRDSDDAVLQDKLDAERQRSATLAAQLNNEHQTQQIMGSVAQQIAPVVASLAALQSDVDKVKCSLPPTISVPYPTVTAINTEMYKAALYGAAAGNYAGGCYGCGYWG